jgi:hypothetical protein
VKNGGDESGEKKGFVSNKTWKSTAITLGLERKTRRKGKREEWNRAKEEKRKGNEE